MVRALLLTAGLGLGLAAVATPAHAAADVGCVSADLRCQGYTCPPGSKTVFDNGFTDTGPWIVICQPKVP
jgi:hypothetical protein